ncbi:sporulation initiation phosphotransferase B [Fredinandcohnia quinoae]|uniref:Sporulation initiation phosphotransferase B n=1 Tax=Fredinandcohnia quinoae TaxID=2918902 RepID=A0AAW5E0W1_9BACI|nr:sporulation initiation phosphotransferase B [Fredinandcohnia sp. SECRCQ15]MCH1626550.1 sporulation initiation phosphotransferase B [Fredinandcohnia sp. SECRCQ15]
MRKNWSTVEVLKHSRHDWLNKIQLIKGNLTMQKIDRVHAIIEEIVIDAQNESKLTNLQLPLFAAFILTYNWESRKCRVDFEVLSESRDLSNHDEVITNWCEQFFTFLESTIDHFGENHLTISIDCSNQNARFFFDFSGIINDAKMLNDWLKESKNMFESIQIKENKVHKEEMTVSIEIT